MYSRIDGSDISLWSFYEMTTKKLIEEVLCLPVEERALIADSLLRSLNVPDAGIDAKWKKVAKRRLEELRSGKVKPIPGDEVFARASKRFAR
jgi:putative addiction module component (TIGR02574 family)